MGSLIGSVGLGLTRLSEPFAQYTNMPLLPAYAPTIVASAGAFFGIQALSRALSPRVSSHYRKLTKRSQEEWNIKVASMVNCAVLLPLVVRCFRVLGAIENDKAFGTHPELLRLSAIATGYFLWDTVVELGRGDAQFVAHGLSTLCIFLFSFRPFVLYFVPVSLVYELSTPFLNIHWFLDKTNCTGSTLQLINGLTLISTFFGARLAYGSYASYQLLTTVWNARGQIPSWLAAIYLVGNPVLNVLNIFWFTKMIRAIQKRFVKKSPPKAD